ncbi:hypothetical protein ABT174_05435 [Streptomyces sparsogenes]|uniref:hypothetical protein n=1 Tax=Streptomyces sparsogenes TaxID=67365 RepID=UPI00331BCB5B
MSMVHAIAWIFEALLRLVLPPSGRHRATHAAVGRPAMRHQHVPTLGTALVSDAPARSMAAERVNGPITPSRPYVVAHEQQRERRAERRLRRRRRRTLWLAVHGIDISPRVIHGVRVVA